eukprot:15855816-Heterocapsa_arctica.AAC.1
MDLLSEDDAARSRFLYNLLVQMCHGRALAIIRLIKSVSGMVVWKRLVGDDSIHRPAAGVGEKTGGVRARDEGARARSVQVRGRATMGAGQGAIISTHQPRRPDGQLLLAYKNALKDFQQRGCEYDAAGQIFNHEEMQPKGQGRGGPVPMD